MTFPVYRQNIITQAADAIYKVATESDWAVYERGGGGSRPPDYPYADVNLLYSMAAMLRRLDAARGGVQENAPLDFSSIGTKPEETS